MKRVNFKFKSTALVLLALGLSSNLWGAGTTVTVAGWGKVSLSANTDVNATTYPSGVTAAKLKSSKALTTAGTGTSKCYYGSSGGGATLTISGLPTSYKITQITFYARASKGGTFGLSYSTDGGINYVTTNLQATSVSVSSSEAQKTVTFSTATAITNFKFVHSATQGSLYFGTVVVTGEAAASEKYTITFNAGVNGTCATSSLKEESAGVGVTLPSATPNTGYEFIGWSTSSSPTEADAGAAGDTYKPSSDCTLYAYYKQFHMVTFLNNGAAAIGAEGVDSQGKKKYYHGEQLGTLPTVGTMTSCDTEHSNVFQGWTASQISGTQTSAPTYIATTTVVNDDNIVLRAVWAAVDD